MKKDPVLVRKLFEEIARCQNPYGLDTIPSIAGYSHEDVSFHIGMLIDEGLVSAEAMENDIACNYLDYFGIRMTWEGSIFFRSQK